MAAVGSDGADYLARLRQPGHRAPSSCRSVDDTYTAQAIIMTDLDNNQITAFHPGAMQRRTRRGAGARATSARHHRARRPRCDAAARRATRRGAAFRSSSIRARACRCSTATSCAQFVEQASWVAVNDYEAQMLSRAHRPERSRRCRARTCAASS